MLKTNLEWHYFKDGVPEVGRRYLHLYKNGDVIFTILYAKIEDEEAYKRAIRLCARNGVTHMSNYLLYNGETRP